MQPNKYIKKQKGDFPQSASVGWALALLLVCKPPAEGGATSPYPGSPLLPILRAACTPHFLTWSFRKQLAHLLCLGKRVGGNRVFSVLGLLYQSTTNWGLKRQKFILPGGQQSEITVPGGLCSFEGYREEPVFAASSFWWSWHSSAPQTVAAELSLPPSPQGHLFIRTPDTGFRDHP